MGTKKEEKDKKIKKVIEIQSEIRKDLKKIGYSITRFAERCFYEIKDSDDKDEMKKYIENFRKSFNRKSSNIDKFRQYQKILYDLPEFSKIDRILLKNHFEDFFSKEFNEEMKKISKEIDIMLKKDNL